MGKTIVYRDVYLDDKTIKKHQEVISKSIRLVHSFGKSMRFEIRIPRKASRLTYGIVQFLDMDGSCKGVCLIKIH